MSHLLSVIMLPFTIADIASIFFNLFIVLPLFIDMGDMSNLSLHLSNLLHIRNGNMTKAEETWDLFLSSNLTCA